METCRRLPRVVAATLAVVTVLGACSGSPASRAPSPSASPSSSPVSPADLVPPDGAWFGVNVDFGSETVAAVAGRLGRSPAVVVQFVGFPFDASDRANLDGFADQVAGTEAHALLTLEPHDGLSAVTDEAIAELGVVLAGWEARGIRTFVRFAHEMNGSWYAWSQQPTSYRAAWGRVASGVRAASPGSAMLWAPNYGAGYPFTGGAFTAGPGSTDFGALDTTGDGELTEEDDPYAPYYPGDDVVDWVGMSLYHWGSRHPWGENEVPESGSFAERLAGTYDGLNGDETAVPDFHAEYALERGKPLAITETAAFYRPSVGGAAEREIKEAWMREVLAPSASHSGVRMVNWFEWRKHEAEVADVVDWRGTAEPDLAGVLKELLERGTFRLGPEATGSAG